MKLFCLSTNFVAIGGDGAGTRCFKIKSLKYWLTSDRLIYLVRRCRAHVQSATGSVGGRGGKFKVLKFKIAFIVKNYYY